MICEKCKKNQATVHMKQIINGDAREVHLCQECASAYDIGNSFAFDFSSMFQDLFNMAAAPVGLEMGHKNSSMKCGVCGMTYNEFMRTGKIGCASCYDTFYNNIQPTLKSIHGSDEHKGKIPQKSGGKMLKKREIDSLKKRLSAAIENEEFEEAAKLRDRIRELGKEE
ncbi:MAG: hypothetical protein HFE62_04105 [Firmicutes bacterium]|nr:hypothetical protein [Bacillota bacterium]